MMKKEIKMKTKDKAHEYNLDAAQREMDRRQAEGEDMTSAKIDKKTYKIVKTKKVAAKEFVAGQLAFQDTWDDGRGNSTTTTRVVLVRSLEQDTKWAIVVLDDGSLAIVGVNTLRHLPKAFKGATI